MKKLVIVLVLSISMIGCSGNRASQNNTEDSVLMLKEIVINHSKEDSDYIYYGYYKEVRRIYNYQYEDSFMYSYALDSTHHVDAFYNEYGDTVYKVYIDVTNYPRRVD